MALLDLLGRRWTLRIVWELRTEPLTFRDLQQRCDAMSASVLNGRLRDLRQAGAVETTADGYQLTDEGHALLQAYEPLNSWALRWARRQKRDDA
jgi:DNA-binding HxlR family transcriptional regulator